MQLYTAVCKALIGKHMSHCNHNLKFPLQESKNSKRNTNQFTIHYSLLTKLMNTRKRYAAKIGYHFSAINRNIRNRTTFTPVVHYNRSRQLLVMSLNKQNQSYFDTRRTNTRSNCPWQPTLQYSFHRMDGYLESSTGQRESPLSSNMKCQH
jgi:hypothetical protein